MTPTTGSRRSERQSDPSAQTIPLQHPERSIIPLSEPIALCFSGGKDSAIALHEIQRRGEYSVAELITTVTDAYDRVSMHGLRRALLHEQAEALGLPVTEVVVLPQSSNAIYEREMGKAFSKIRDKGICRIAFGDIFLEDLRDHLPEPL